MDSKKQLKRQLGFLSRSSALCDGGDTDEAIRIAVSIRVLVHNSTTSHALSRQLGADNIKLLSTCGDPLGDLSRLVFFDGFGGIVSPAGIRPKLGHCAADSKKMVPVGEWWPQIVYVAQGIRFSRKSIVLCAANQDGGAHVDPELDPDYKLLTTPGSTGVFVTVRNGESKVQLLDDYHLRALRQMAYELLSSPELLALAT
jgi:hypothetical protein